MANMSTEGSREVGVTEVLEQGEGIAEPPPTIYWAYKSNPGPGTGVVVKTRFPDIDQDRGFMAWNQIPIDPPTREFQVNQYKELVHQKQPVPTDKHHSQLEREEESGRHDLGTSVINEGLPLDIPDSLQELSITNTLLMKRPRNADPSLKKFTIVNKTADKPFWWAEEDSSTLGRLLHGRMRSFTMVFRDAHSKEVAHMVRPFKWGCSCCTMCSFCCFCQRQRMDVESPPGNFLGAVREEKTWSVCHNLIVSNIEDRPILRIVGPSGGFVNFGSTYYPIYSLVRKNQEIGRIIRRAAGTSPEDGFTYSIQYPLRIRPELKLIILSAAVLIDYMQFYDGSQ